MQGEVEKRLALRLEMTGSKVHALLDLMDVVLEEVVDLPLAEVTVGDVTHRMAERAGIPAPAMQSFLDEYDRVTNEVQAEGLYLGPEDFLRVLRRKTNRKG